MLTKRVLGGMGTGILKIICRSGLCPWYTRIFWVRGVLWNDPQRRIVCLLGSRSLILWGDLACLVCVFWVGGIEGGGFGVGFLVAGICRLCGQCVCCPWALVSSFVYAMKALRWDCFEHFCDVCRFVVVCGLRSFLMDKVRVNLLCQLVWWQYGIVFVMIWCSISQCGLGCLFVWFLGVLLVWEIL